MSRLGRNFRRAAAQVPTLIQRAINVLRKFGTDAHIWLPGVGSINGLQAANYLLSDASTGLAPVDQYVGLVGDALGGLGAELVTNGDFSNGVVNWVESAPGHWAVVGGRAYHAFSSLYKELGQTFTTKPAGPSYKISIAYEVTSGSAQFFYANEAGTTQVTVFTASSGVVEKVITDGIKKIGFSRASSGGEFYIDNISVREVTGIHATQPTTASKPKLVRGAVNQLTYSGDFANAAWGVGGITKSAGVITEDTSTSIHALLRYSTWPAATASTAAFVVSPGTATKCWIGNASAATATCFDLTTGVVEGNIGSIVGYITALGGGQYLIAARHTAASAQTLALGMYVTYAAGSYNGTVIYTGTSRTLNVVSAGLFQGTYTAAQIQALGGLPLTTTAPASTALGSFAWQFDGSNDSLALSSVPFQMGDDHWVVGVFSNTLATGDRYIFDVGNSASVNSMVASIALNNTTAKCYWRDDALVATILAGGTIPLGTTAVLSARKIGSAVVLRVNGVVVATGTVNAGATTLTGACIGVRVALGNLLAGNANLVQCGKGTITDAELALIEKLAANAAGIVL